MLSAPHVPFADLAANLPCQMTPEFSYVGLNDDLQHVTNVSATVVYTFRCHNMTTCMQCLQVHQADQTRRLPSWCYGKMMKK